MVAKIEKIPASLVGSYEKCARLAYLKHHGRVAGQYPKRRQVGIITHKAFKEFNELWTDDFYNSSNPRTGLQRLKLILENAEKKVNESAKTTPGYLENSNEVNSKLKRLFRGNNGYIAKIVETAQKILNGDSFPTQKLVPEFFKGEPSFERSIGTDEVPAQADVYVENEGAQEFSVWELKTGNPPSAPPLAHLIQVATEAYSQENASSFKCVGLKIMYLGEKEFLIPFTDDLRKKAKEMIEKVKDNLSQDKNSLPKNKSRCKACKDVDTCEKEFKKSKDLKEMMRDDEEEEGESSPEDGSTQPPVPESVLQETSNSEEATTDDTETQPVSPTEGDSGQSPESVEESALPSISEENYTPTPVPEEGNTPPPVIPVTTGSEKSVATPGAPFPAATDVVEEGEEDKMGIVIQSEQAPLILSLDKDNKLCGAVRSTFQRSIHAGQILIADSDDITKPAAIVEVREVSSFPKDIASTFLHINTFNIYVETLPFLYYEKEKYSKVLFPADFSLHHLRMPNNDELIKIMNLHAEGIPLGLVTYETLDNAMPKEVLPYFFPFSYKEVGYKGIFVVGSPGKGKTNILKILVNGLAHYIQTPTGQPPAVLILDTTGQFAELDKFTKLSTTFDEEIWDTLDMHVVEASQIKNYKIKYDHGPGDYTLTLNAVDPELVTLLFPDLPPNSAQNFRRIVKDLLRRYPAISYDDFKTKLPLELDREGDLLNPMVKKAIVNAVRNGPAEFFDQGGLPLRVEDLIVPGRVSVVQVDHISDNLPILLYILMMINKRKIYENDPTPLVLMLDEAHELFPRVVIDTQRTDYLRRITQSLIRIARIGRKKKFGLIFASQQPKDVIPEIIGVFQTKIIMGLESTSKEWIRDEVGREYINTILKLEQGYARVNSAELHKGTLVPLFIPRAPNKHEEE